MTILISMMDYSKTDFHYQRLFLEWKKLYDWTKKISTRLQKKHFPVMIIPSAKGCNATRCRNTRGWALARLSGKHFLGKSFLNCVSSPDLTPIFFSLLDDLNSMIYQTIYKLWLNSIKKGITEEIRNIQPKT